MSTNYLHRIELHGFSKKHGFSAALPISSKSITFKSVKLLMRNLFSRIQLVLAFTLGLTFFTGLNAATAQITITTAEMPSSSDTLRMSNATVFNPVDVSTTGPNQTWDFSSLQENSQVMWQYKNSSQTPYAFYFFNSYGRKIADTLGAGQLQFTDVYQFYRNTSSQFTVRGTGFKYSILPLAGNYSDEDEVFFFPLNFGDRDSSNFDYEIALPAVGSYGSKGYRITEVDGWGSVTTPFGTFNVIRTVAYIRAIDTVNIAGTGFAVENNRREYKWLANNQRAPIVQVTGSEVFGAFVPTQTQYRDSWRRFALQENEILPDASNAGALNFTRIGQQITVMTGNKAGSITIIDMLGRTVATQSVSTGQTSTQIALPAESGIYILSFKEESGRVLTAKLAN